MSLVSQLRALQPNLSRAESRIAKVILSNPEAMVNITTAGLARLAGVSDPMISRFCRTLGCDGFPDFKVKLAQSLTEKVAFISEAVSPGDTVERVIEKRINANQAALEYLRKKLDGSLINQAIEGLARSKRIEIFGMGGSAAIAQDAQNKLFRLGIPATAYSDYLMQRMVAAAANENTAILCFSFTGRTQPTVEVAKIAKENQAMIIAITNPDSPLAAFADVTITSGDELEDTTIYVPMTTRIISLTIVDILATGVALACGPAVTGQLKRIKHSLDGTKIET